MWGVLLSMLAHHGEPADPVLIEWIKHRIDSIIGLGAGGMVIILTILICLIPITLVGILPVSYTHLTLPTILLV